jgi:uncharacterized small protein (DUF1192 family)
LDGFKMVGDEGVPDMYSRIKLLTNEIARLRSKEITSLEEDTS